MAKLLRGWPSCALRARAGLALSRLDPEAAVRCVARTRSPAPVRPYAVRRWSATIRGEPQFRSASGAEPRHSTGPPCGGCEECCKADCSVPVDPVPTAAAARTTRGAADCAEFLLSGERAAALAPSLFRSARKSSQPLASRTKSAAEYRHSVCGGRG